MKMAERLDINIKRYQRLERMEAEPDAVILNSLYTLFGYSPLIILHENLYYAEDRKSTRLNSSHNVISRMPSSA